MKKLIIIFLLLIGVAYGQAPVTPAGPIATQFIRDLSDNSRWIHDAYGYLQLGTGGGGPTIYTGDGAIIGTRSVTFNTTLQFSGIGSGTDVLLYLDTSKIQIFTQGALNGNIFIIDTTQLYLNNQHYIFSIDNTSSDGIRFFSPFSNTNLFAVNDNEFNYQSSGGVFNVGVGASYLTGQLNISPDAYTLYAGNTTEFVNNSADSTQWNIQQRHSGKNKSIIVGENSITGYGIIIQDDQDRVFLNYSSHPNYTGTGTSDLQIPDIRLVDSLITAAGGSGVNIYNSDGSLTGNRTVTLGSNSLTFASTNTTYSQTEGGGTPNITIGASNPSGLVGSAIQFNNGGSSLGVTLTTGGLFFSGFVFDTFGGVAFQDDNNSAGLYYTGNFSVNGFNNHGYRAILDAGWALDQITGGQPLNYATATALAANTYANGTGGNGATLTATANGTLSIDGSTPSVGETVLVKDEVTQSHNGPYTVTTVGSGSVKYKLTRNSANTIAYTLQAGSNFYIASGSTNASKVYYQTTSGAVTPGTTNLVYATTGGVSAVTSVTGTTNRITSTGGTTPVIDISATFEALLGKVASPLSQFASTTSAQLAGVISDETGSGLLVYSTSPSLTTPSLGVATATSINGNIFTTGTYTLTGVAGKTLTFSNTLTLAGTDGCTLNVGAGGTLGSNAFTSTAYAPIASPTFTGTVTIPTPFTLGAVSVTSTGTQLNFLNAAAGTTGTASTNIVFSTSPTITTPTISGHFTAEGVTTTGATGTGNLVFSAGATFTGTTTLGTTNLSNVALGTVGNNNNLTISGSSSPFAGTAVALYQLNGSTSMRYRVGAVGNTSTTIGASDSYAGNLFGGSNITTNTSGTSAILTNVGIGSTGTFTLGTGSTTTWATSFYIDGPPTITGSGTLTNPVLAMYVKSGNSLFGGNVSLGLGNELKITEGSGGFAGQTTLVSGTKAITISGVTTSSRALVQLVTPTGVTLTTTYQAVCTSNTLTIQANVATGTINASDGSTLNYFIIN